MAANEGTTGAGRLAGKVAIVTGTGGSGCGRAAALLFAREGAHVVGCDLDAAGAAATLAAVRAAGGEMTSLHACDLSDPAQAAALAAHAIAAYGRIDVVFNNAGNARLGWFEELSSEQLGFTTRHCVETIFHVTKAVWPHLVAGGGGAIVNASSLAANRATKGFGSLTLAAGKGAVAAMTRQLAREGGRHGIRVNTLSPGMVETAITRRLLEDDRFRAGIVDGLMLPRWGQPEDAARAALFLASDDAEWITGIDLVVDGGASAW